MEADDIIKHFDLPGTVQPVVTQLVHEEDGEPYQVWKLDCGGDMYLLKEAKEYEAELYRSILPRVGGSVPALYQTADIDGKTYLLMEFVEGSDLRECSRRKLTLALDALICMQRATWGDRTLSGCAYTFEKSLKDREHRGKYLNDPELEAAYARFLDVYSSTPRALCHDDLLPFNVIVSEDRAVLIDWEFAGLLPYPVSFARLIAHGEDNENAFFRMTQADKAFAIDYYHDHLLKEMGIGYEEWRRTLEFFLFYEYCEWVFIGNKYEGANEEYYRKYLCLAKWQADKILRIS